MRVEDKTDPSFAFITGVPFLMMAMLIFWAGLYGLRSYFDIFTVITTTAYHLIKIVLSLIVVTFAIVSIKSGWLTEGIVFMVFATSSLSTSISYLLELQEIAQLDLVYGLIIIVCSVFMLRRLVVFRGLASLFVGISLTLPTLLPSDAAIVTPVCFVISAALFFIYFGYVMYHTDDDKKFVSERDERGNREGHVSDVYETVMVVGGLTVGLCYIFEAGIVLSGLTLGKTSVIVSILMISVVAIAIGIYASMKGELAEAVLIMMIAIYYLFISMSFIGGFDVSPVAVEFVTSAVLLSTMISFYLRRNWILLVIATLAFVEGIVTALVTISPDLIAWYDIVTGALCIYAAVSIWIIVELKMEILPVFDGYGGGR